MLNTCIQKLLLLNNQNGMPGYFKDELKDKQKGAKNIRNTAQAGREREREKKEEKN